MNYRDRFRPTALAVFSAAVLIVGCSDRATRNEAADNQTQLDPVITTMDDDRIVAAVRAKYYSANDIKAQNIDVSSDRGVVTLKGPVPSDAVRQQAVSIAKNVDGVSNVNDQLRVQAGDNATQAARREGNSGEEPDTADSGMVTTKILAQYYLNPQLKPWKIDVTTSQDGVVTLEGRIDNDNDRAEAVRIAKSTDGVTEVQDRLRAGDVAATAGTTGNDRNQADRSGGDLSDAWITTKIQSRFFVDPDIKARDINVDTKNGTVVLRGTVGSYSARRQAVSTARNTDGVREVQDELRVDTSRDDTGRGSSTRSAAAKVDDAWITTKIESKFFVDGDLRASGVDVTTRNGVVTLKGSVASDAARNNAVQLARDTDGVRNVRDQLKVAADSAAR